MVESAKRHTDILEKLNFYDYALSLKASNLDLCIEAYEEAAKQFKCPLHLGITESGTEFSGTIKSSIGLGYLLRQGIGDTVRVSLSDDPIKEIKVAKEILKDCNLYSKVPTLVACPTCGRTQIDLIPIAKKGREIFANNRIRYYSCCNGMCCKWSGRSKRSRYRNCRRNKRGTFI